MKRINAIKFKRKNLTEAVVLAINTSYQLELFPTQDLQQIFQQHILTHTPSFSDFSIWIKYPIDIERERERKRERESFIHYI